MKQEIMKPPTWMPENGGAYLCLKGSKESSTKKGKVYIYENHFCGSGELVHYSKRWQTRLLNGYNALRQPGNFEPVKSCPFCKAQMYDPPDSGYLVHNAEQCAKDNE